VQFYQSHLLKSTNTPPQLILLTDDRRNRELASTEGITAVSAREYVDGLEASVRESVVDLVVGGVDEVQGERRGRRVYDDVSGLALASSVQCAEHSSTVSISRCPRCGCEGWKILSGLLQRQSVQLPRGEFHAFHWCIDIG
jgi:hypothetical protein